MAAVPSHGQGGEDSGLGATQTLHPQQMGRRGLSSQPLSASGMLAAWSEAAPDGVGPTLQREVSVYNADGLGDTRASQGRGRSPLT